MEGTSCRNCSIKYDAHAGESIVFCSLHEAAQGLLTAAKDLVEAYDLQSVTDQEYPELGRLRAAIGKAEGR